MYFLIGNEKRKILFYCWVVAVRHAKKKYMFSAYLKQMNFPGKKHNKRRVAV